MNRMYKILLGISISTALLSSLHASHTQSTKAADSPIMDAIQETLITIHTQKSQTHQWVSNLVGKDITKLYRLNPFYWIHTTDTLPTYLSPEHIEPDTLVIFDVDEVLLCPTEAVFRYGLSELLTSDLFRFIAGKYGVGRLEEIGYTMSRQTLDADTPTLMAKLQEKGIKCMALTFHHTGKRGRIQAVENTRIQTLQQEGYHMEASWPRGFKCVLNFPKTRGCTPPVFKEGVLCTGKFPKGKVLRKFLETLNWKPKHIIFVDDLSLHHESVGKLANLLRIPSIGIHYTKAASAATMRSLTKDEQARAVFQLTHLYHTGQWPSKDQTDNAMKTAPAQHYKTSPIIP